MSTFMGLAVPLFPNGPVVIDGQSATAADDLLVLELAASQTGDFLVARNSSESELFVVGASGAIKTMVLGTLAVASIASNASASYSVAGITTDHAVHLFPMKTLTTGDGIVQAFAQGTTRIDVFALGSSVAANTYAVWAFNIA